MERCEEYLYYCNTKYLYCHSGGKFAKFLFSLSILGTDLFLFFSFTGGGGSIIGDGDFGGGSIPLLRKDLRPIFINLCNNNNIKEVFCVVFKLYFCLS